MSIKVRFFASMRDRMGKGDATVNFSGAKMTVTDVWQQAANGAPMPESTLIAINMEYTDNNAVVKDGDEVAFFPPVTGG